MKRANIPVYGNSAVYIHDCTVCITKNYALRSLEYIGSVSSPLRCHADMMTNIF